MEPEAPKPQPGAIFNPQTDAAQAAPPPAAPEPAPAPAPAQTPVQESGPEPVQPEPAPAAEATEPAEADTPVLQWQASEFVHHDKRIGWYLIFFVVVAALVAVAVITHQWLSIGVFGLMAVALLVYTKKQPRVLNYSLGDRGLTIDTKFYDYDSFRTFGVIQDLAWHLIDLEPMRRFMPRLNILFEDDNRDQIIELLEQHLPRQDREPDLVERAARYLHF
ncbi:MAG TPA: hypothetical protein VLE72_03655 [Candidatus Saccharimonadales bacterium]|nr:hypothetical protein [Candidatus Saccharimonadales bacterium]